MKTCIALPLERLADALQEFVQRPELRILHVATDGHLRSGALRVLMAGEYLAQNRSPWIGLNVPGTTPDWAALEPELLAAHEKLREAKAPLREVTEEIAGRGAGRFAARLVQCLVSVQAPASGLVLLLISAEPELDVSWLVELQKLAFDPVLERARFVLLSTDHPTTWEWSQALPLDKALDNRCVVDPDAAADELEGEIATEAKHGRGKGGARSPGEEPPAQKGGELPDLPPKGPKDRAEPGPEPGPAQPEPETVSLCVKRALLAMRRSDRAEAVEQQTRARDLCLRDGRREDAVRMEMVLGGFMLEMKETRHALDAFGRAATMAAEIEAHGLQAQAHYAEAYIHKDERQMDSALRAYWSGIDAAKRGDEPKLAFDGYWDAGTQLRALDRKDSVVSLWTDAVSYANTLPPPKLEGTRMPQIAKELSIVLRSMRRPSDAAAIDDWAAQTFD